MLITNVEEPTMRIVQCNGGKTYTSLERFTKPLIDFYLGVPNQQNRQFLLLIICPSRRRLSLKTVNIFSDSIVEVQAAQTSTRK